MIARQIGEDRRAKLQAVDTTLIEAVRGNLHRDSPGAAPRAAASATKLWPSSTAPRTAQNSMPRSSRRASAVRPVIEGLGLTRVSGASIKTPARASASTTSCSDLLTGGILDAVPQTR